MTELGKFEVALASNELMLSASITPAHRTLLASYRMNDHSSANSARDLILRDLRNFLDLGALDRAMDLMIVLALYMKEGARSDRRLAFATRRHRDGISLQRSRGGARTYAAGGKGRRKEPEGASAPLVTPQFFDSLDNEDGDRPS